MRPEQFRHARREAGQTQVQAAACLGVSQPYLSQLERGTRPVTAELAQRAAAAWRLPPASLPLPDPGPEPTLPNAADHLARQLAALGYPGFAHLTGVAPVNPAAVLLAALRQPDLEVRVSEALPWVAVHHADLDWSWLVRQAKLHDVQNRLGFVVVLAADLAERSGRTTVRAALDAVAEQLERARLAREDTLCRESMPTAERRWLAATRSALARHWNLLTGLTVEQLVHG
jgi:transcriptional regulator with XRE-family HTH domain